MRRILQAMIMIAVVLWLMARIPAAGRMLMAPVTLFEGVAAGVEIQQIEKCILAERTLNGVLPSEPRFPELIRSRFESKLKDPLLDSWRRPYQYRLAGAGFELRSLGPDGMALTADDLVLQWEPSA